MAIARDVEATKNLVCDLHTHTLYSPDCLTTLAGFLEACRRKGLDRVAVTDHDTITGALRLKDQAPDLIVVGQEIRTTHGELIAYFLEKAVPGGLSPEETIAIVRAQGGVVGASHPLDRLRQEAIGLDGLRPIRDQLDFVEVFNARCILATDNRAARSLAEDWGLSMTAGSDAHSVWELGRAVTILPAFDCPASFLSSLRAARIRGRVSPFWIHFATIYAKFVRRLGKVPMPGV
jgi:predicted metal-dependent phosphoesterase TrpH